MNGPLAVGVVVAVGCLAYVLYPLIARRRGAAPSRRAAARVVTDEEIEAVVRSYRAAQPAGDACSRCGPRPESDAIFCSNCGQRLTAAGRTR